MIWIFIAVLILPLLALQLVGYWLSGPHYKGSVTDHFDGKRFYNYGNQERRSYALTRDRGPWTEVKNSPSTMPPEKEIRDRIRITHINHTTFLIQLDGINILTDPIWSERASPFSWIGPKRMRPPAFPLHELPPIHLILLSHNHYDHLDLATLKHLDLMFKPSYIVPLGVSLLLNENSIGTNITELDWWQVNPFQGLRIEGLPAHHSTARGAFDRDCTLWCGKVAWARFTLQVTQGTIRRLSGRLAKVPAHSGYRSFRSEPTNRCGSCRPCIVHPPKH
jgi:hypothetical protein